MSRITVIIPAAGSSTRFGGSEKKPFLTLDGKPIWQRSVELFCNRADVSHVFLVISPDDRDEFRQKFGGKIALVYSNVHVVDGGAERFESVANALGRVPSDGELVAVHDAVRPLTSAAHIDAVFQAATEHGAAMLAIPVADTLKRVDPATNRITDTVPRSGLWQAQTPQVFRQDWLMDAYARRSTFPGTITDDAQLVEAAGRAVMVVQGSPLNFKITTRDDFTLAEAVLNPKPIDPPKPTCAFHDEPAW